VEGGCWFCQLTTPMQPTAEVSWLWCTEGLRRVMGGSAKLVDKVKAGKAKLGGNIQVLEQLKVTLVKFDPFFEILPGTKAITAPAGKPSKDEVFEDDAPVVKDP
jgi:alkyl sulfatase BDS1-like metallo-beta-lactamase superfamily hydrolase